MGAIAACALAFVLPAVADANTYCVNEPACVTAGGTNEGANGEAVQKALEAASTHANSGGADEVAIGAGTYIRTNGYSYGGDAAVIRGAGAGATILTDAASNPSSVMAFTSASSILRALTIEAPAATDVTALTQTAGHVEEVTIAGTKAGTSSTGLKITGGVFAAGSVVMSTTAASEDTGVEAGGGEVTGSSITGENAVQVANSPVLRGSRIYTNAIGLTVTASSATLEDTLIDLGGHSASGVMLVGNTNGVAEGTFRQLTIVNGGPSSRGLLVTGEGKHKAKAVFENSVIAGVERPLVVTGQAEALGSVTASYSSYEAAKDSVSAFATVFDEHHASPTPGFVSPVLGGFESGDWRLLATSALIDAGSPGGLAIGEYAFDAAGNPRIVNGQRDVGAYEYQRRPPLATASATPATVTAGTAIDFNGSGSVQEAGDAIASYQWSFDDGGSATTAAATHSFTTAGTHTATLTVTDAIGLTAQATTGVNVTANPTSAPATPSGHAPALTLVSSGPSGLRLSPGSFHAARTGASVLHAKRGGALISYRLSAPALVSFTVERIVAGVTRGKNCVARRAGLHGKSCVRRLKLGGSFTSKGTSGTNSLRFSGRMAGKALAKGSYVLLAHTTGRVARAPFRILA
jgi:PKD repeat protein